MERILPRLSGVDRTAFIAAARSLLGKPFVHKGRTERGVDCVGLCVYGLAQIGVACEDLADYSMSPDGVTLQQKVEAHLGPPTDNWQPGDIVLMRWYEHGNTVYCNHVGILGVAPYGNFWTLIHSHRESLRRRGQENRVKEVRLAKPWDSRVFAVYSLTGDVP